MKAQHKNYQIHLVFILAILLIGFSARSQSWNDVHPGLYEADGSPHPLHTPHAVTGRTRDVTAYGADPADNNNDDRPAIEAALTAAVAGDELYFPAGVYNLYSVKPTDKTVHFVLKSGVNWRGEGPDKSFLRSEFSDQTIARFLKLRGLENILISNLTLTSAFKGPYSTDVNVNNPAAAGPQYVISIEDNNGWPSSNITVDSLRVENYRVHGVRLSNSHDVVVRRSTFLKATDVAGGGAGYGISIQGNSLPDNASRFNVVEQCRFTGPYIRHAILLQYATHNNVVRFNYCDNTRLDAIDLHGEDEYLNEIHDNRVENVTTGAGVGVGNTGATHDSSGPFNYIHHNLFINCREGVKVYLGSPDTRIEHNEVTGSKVSSGKGIYILNGPRTIVKSNRIHDNPGSGFSGIYLQYDNGENGKNTGPPQDVRILENLVFNNAYGVRLMSGVRIIYEDNDVHDNLSGNFYAAGSVTIYKWLDVQTVGSGRIEFEPGGGSYPSGTQVTLSAWPLANWRFDHWEGDLTGVENPATLRMDKSLHITAVFTAKSGSDEVNLMVTIAGQGGVQLDPPGGVYERGTLVKVQAEAEAGWKFSQWSGDIETTVMVDSLIMDADKTITAHFEQKTLHKIIMWIVGTGAVQFDPPGGSYAEGTQVIVTAVPAAGWYFKNWDGALSGSENPDTLIMDEEKAVMAVFAQGTGINRPDLAKHFELQQNYPNPFNSSTCIPFSLEAAGPVRIDILNTLGRTVRSLASGVLVQGHHRFTWDGYDEMGKEAGAGLYFCRITTAQGTKRIKMSLLR